MTKRSTFAKAGLTGVAGVMALTAALSVPSFAQAQSGYYGQGNYNYDPCRRDSTNRGTTGALIGGALGAVIGSNAAARNARTEGALLGGALGAAVGAGVGKSSAACAPQTRQGYYGRSQNYGYNNGYNNGYYGNQNYGYQGGYYNGGYQNDGYAYDRYGNSYTVGQSQQADTNGCTLAESPIYLPDGRVQKRFVRVCPDSNGRYQVVD